MSEAESRRVARTFGTEDARALARSIIESDAGRACHWTAAAVDTVAAIILWEARKGEDGQLAAGCRAVTAATPGVAG
jgi:hypothetical protein